VSALSKSEEIQELGDIIPPVNLLEFVREVRWEIAEANRIPESWLSSRKEARIAALSF
jgi:hypothetical protein